MSDASAKLRLGTPRGVLGAVLSTTRRGIRNISSSPERYGHHHSQGTEGRDYCPHSILLRPHLRLAGGFGTAGAENSCEERRQRKLEQLPGARRLPWSGAGSAWGRGSVGGSPQRCGDGHPEAWLLTEVRGGRWRDGERERKQGSGRAHPNLLEVPGPAPRVDVHEEPHCLCIAPPTGHSLGFPFPGRWEQSHGHAWARP